ncbi:MAG TPA: hypothetical protein VMP11_06010 [Verrucomicrobiae bacterium]|nr:hypothetical protein [Verrucomicrobiae bacterium]
MKGTTSMKQVEANRKNASRSTGPRTAHGKACSRLNAAKRGMLAREVVLRGRYEDEHEREFQAIYRRYWDYYAPEGPMEEMLVERIATSYWRLHRVIIAERGEIGESVHEARMRRDEFSPAKFQVALLTGRAESSTLGLAYLQHILEGVRASVEKDGALTKEAEERVATAFADEPNSISAGLRKAREVARSGAEGLEAEALRAKERELVLGYVEKELARCEAKTALAAEREEHEAEARRDATFLPETAVAEKIVRYEGSLERQLYRAMNQLERMQRLRKGEAVPPPLAVQVAQ